MATGKGKSHNLGTSAGGKVDHAVGQRRPRRQAVSAKPGRAGGGDRSSATRPLADRPPYSMLIRWSDEDQCYIVTLPEFDDATTHGKTYQSAARSGADLIDSFVLWYEQDGKPLPIPEKFAVPELLEMTV